MGTFPSREHQFPPGNNANPAGRPKGRPVEAMLRRRIAGESASGEPIAEVLAATLLKLAADLDNPKVALAAIREILDRTEGKARQAIEVTGEGGGPVAVTVYLPANGRDDGNLPAEFAPPGAVPGEPV